MARLDGRANDELRPVRITPDYLDYAEGSALIEMGATRVLCAVSTEERVPPWLQGRGQGWLTAEYAMLHRSTVVRTPREVLGLRGRTQEIRRFIGRSLRAAVDL
ncbi:MAG TPA: ribonuclease PH, partial [Anaerolineae bacterium]|nr:ribonuclease PH [Anaerolineae bacterium]